MITAALSGFQPRTMGWVELQDNNQALNFGGDDSGCDPIDHLVSWFGVSCGLGIRFLHCQPDDQHSRRVHREPSQQRCITIPAYERLGPQLSPNVVAFQPDAFRIGAGG